MGEEDAAKAFAMKEWQKSVARRLLDAAEAGDVNLLVRMLDYCGAGLVNDARDVDGSTCLHTACEEGHVGVVKALLDRGGAALLSATNNSGDTPLHCASQHGRLGVAWCLLARGADVNATNRYGRTPRGCVTKGGSLRPQQMAVAALLDVAAMLQPRARDCGPVG